MKMVMAVLLFSIMIKCLEKLADDLKINMDMSKEE